MKRLCNFLLDSGLKLAVLLATSLAARASLAEITSASPTNAADTNVPAQLPDVVVTGQGTQPSGGDVVDSSVPGLPSTFHESPRNVTVITEERIREPTFRRRVAR